MNNFTNPAPFLFNQLTRDAGTEFPVSPATKRRWTQANPFSLPRSIRRADVSTAKPRLRSAVLTDEASRLYRCIAFAMLQYGAVMNGHMTIVWKAWGIRDHAQAVSVLTEFNARMGKWLSVDATGRKRKGVTSSTYGVGEKYFYAFVHENTTERGFHTHQLIGVTDGKARAFSGEPLKFSRG